MEKHKTELISKAPKSPDDDDDFHGRQAGFSGPSPIYLSFARIVAAGEAPYHPESTRRCVSAVRTGRVFHSSDSEEEKRKRREREEWDEALKESLKTEQESMFTMMKVGHPVSCRVPMEM